MLRLRKPQAAAHRQLLCCPRCSAAVGNQSYSDQYSAIDGCCPQVLLEFGPAKVRRPAPVFVNPTLPLILRIKSGWPTAYVCRGISAGEERCPARWW
jgi:hypothetical protein